MKPIAVLFNNRESAYALKTRKELGRVFANKQPSLMECDKIRVDYDNRRFAEVGIGTSTNWIFDVNEIIFEDETKMDKGQ